MSRRNSTRARFAHPQVAGAAGWHKFRVREKGDTTYLPGEVHCPASTEKGHLTNCVTCGACDGTTGDRVLDVHGNKAANFDIAYVRHPGTNL